MATRKSYKTIRAYLEEIGAADTTNEYLIQEFEYNESLGIRLKIDLEKNGLFSEKGRLSQAYIGYKMYVNNKILLLTKLAMTVQDRSKLKLKQKEDAIQLQFKSFMTEASGF